MSAVLLLCLIALFSFSSAVYQIRREQRTYTLLFPSAGSEYDGQSFLQLYAEQRKIPIPQVLTTEWNLRERKVYYLVKELLYGPGPGMIRSYPFVPAGTRVQSLAIQDSDLYIDFNATLLEGKPEHHFDSKAVFPLFEKILRLNFPQLRGIYFTVEGISVSRFRQKLLLREHQSTPEFSATES